MEFAEIFVDCYEQALRARSRADKGEEGDIMFVPKLTKGMVEPTLTSEASVETTKDMPTPSTLGDFVKLLGSTVHARLSKGGLDLGEVTVSPVADTISLAETMDLLRDSIGFSSQKWALARIGELSSFDSIPEKNPVSVQHADFRSFMTRENSMGNPEDRSTRFRIFEAEMIRKEIGLRMQPQHTEKECCRILNGAWDAWQQQDNMSQSEWMPYEIWLMEQQPPGYAMTIVYLTALIGCGLGISALSWVRERMVPVLVNLSEIRLLGLVQRDAATLHQAWYASKYFLGYHAVQKLSDFGVKGFDISGFTGRDCVLTVNLEIEGRPISREVMGLLPDLVDADSKQELRERFEKVFPNDGHSAAMIFIRLG